MTHKSVLKIIACSAATLTLGLTFLPQSNASQIEGKVKITQEQDTESQLWGEIQGDFDSCQTSKEESAAIAARQAEEKDRTLASTELNNIEIKNQTNNNSLQICQ